MSYIEDSVLSTIKWEGTIPWMYLDSERNVTVGCGELLRNPATACALPFQSPSGGAATTDEIILDFRRVQAMAPDMEAAAYQADSSPVLTANQMQQMVTLTVQGNDAELREGYAGWDSFPVAVKQALLDMAYNIGYGELMNGYPEMDAAVRTENWPVAAEQCFRNGISRARNDWTKNLFLQAVGIA